jgi:multidrug resistance protein
VLPLLQLYAKELGASATVVGLLVGSHAFAALLTAPYWGRFSDRFGRRPAILLGLVASGLAYLLFGLSHSLWTLLVSRLVQGVGAGTVGVVQAYVSDTVAPNERAKALGWITVATSLGVMLGPTIGSLAVRFLGDQAPGFVAAGFALINVIVAAKLLPEPLVPRGPSTKRHLGHAAADVIRRPTQPAYRMIWIYAAGMMAFMGMNGVLALFMAERYGTNKDSVGYFYTYFGVLSIIMRGGVLGRLVDKLGEVRVLRLGTLSLCAGLALVPFARTVPAFAIVVVLVPVGTALLFPATTSQISRYAPAGHLGEFMGLQQAFGGVARVLGPVGAGFIFQHLGDGWPFWIGSLLMATAGMLAFGATLGSESGAPAATPASAATTSAAPSPTLSAAAVEPGSGRGSSAAS